MLSNFDLLETTLNIYSRNLLRLTNGKRRFDIPSRRSGSYEVSLQLPKGITCSQCVLQWKHKDGKCVRHVVQVRMPRL